MMPCLSLTTKIVPQGLLACWLAAAAFLSPGVASAQDILVRADLVVANPERSVTCRVGLTLVLERGRVFVRYESNDCGSRTAAQQIAPWRDAPVNGEIVVRLTCNREFGDPFIRCSDGSLRESFSDWRSHEQIRATRSSSVRDDLVTFTEISESSYRTEALDGTSLSGSGRIAETIGIRHSGRNCTVVSYERRMAPDLRQFDSVLVSGTCRVQPR